MENTLIWLQEMEDNNESWVNVSSVIAMLKKEQEQAINYSQCYKSDSEQLADKEKQKSLIIEMMKKDEEDGLYNKS